MLHPQVRAMLDLMIEREVPPIHTLSPQDARTMFRERRTAIQPDPPAVAEVLDMICAGPHGPLPMRMFKPAARLRSAQGSQDALPVLVYFHGGGWVIGDLDVYDTLCRQLANQAGCAVVSVDYRMGPEHRFPAAVDDSYAALLWVASHAHQLGVDRERIAVGGDSAGGNLAAVVAILARDDAQAQPHLNLVFQLLIYPVTDMRRGHASHRTNGEGFGLTRDTMAYFEKHYLSDPRHVEDWRVSPLLAPDLSRLPPGLLITAGFDPLRDEGLAYADALSEAGTDVTYVCFDRQVHGFVPMGRVYSEADTAVALCAAELTRAFRPRD